MNSVVEPTFGVSLSDYTEFGIHTFWIAEKLIYLLHSEFPNYSLIQQHKMLKKIVLLIVIEYFRLMESTYCLYLHIRRA